MSSREDSRTKYSKKRRKPSNKVKLDQQIADGSQVRGSNKEGAVACMRVDAANDPSWYMQSPELAKSASSLPFSQTTGGFPAFNDAVPPGVLSIEYWPTLGGAYLDPLNQAANMMYSYTVHANSRNTKYDAPDEMLIVIAASQLFAAIAMGVRAYGVIKWYEQRNAYVPDTLVLAMGFDPEDLRANLSKMWFDLNLLIDQATQLWVPKDMPVFQRWFWLNSNVYMDGDTFRSQMYIFVPKGFWQYKEGPDSPDGTGAGALQMRGWANHTTTQPVNKRTWQEYMNMVNDMLASLINSQDRGIIFGDILKAYGDNIFKMNPIDSSYKVVPVYSQEVLSQIENLTTIQSIPVSVIQDKNTVTLKEYWSPLAEENPSGQCLPGKVVLNFHQDTIPTNEQIFVATRLQAVGNIMAQYEGVEGDPSITPYACGTEVVYTVIMWARNPRTRNVAGMLFPLKWEKSGSDFVMPVKPDKVGLYMAFDWAPFIYVLDSTETGQWVNSKKPGTHLFDVVHAYGDYDMYTIVDASNLQQLHQTALYSLFGVPKIG
nr:putative capsid [Marmot picobirnavirus]